MQVENAAQCNKSNAAGRYEIGRGAYMDVYVKPKFIRRLLVRILLGWKWHEKAIRNATNV